MRTAIILTLLLLPSCTTLVPEPKAERPSAELCESCEAGLTAPPWEFSSLEPPTELQVARRDLGLALLRSAAEQGEQCGDAQRHLLRMVESALTSCDLGTVGGSVPGLCRLVDCQQDPETMPEE